MTTSTDLLLESDSNPKPPSSKSPTPSCPLTPSQIKSHLTQIIHSIAAAATNRNFSLSSPPWSTHFCENARFSTGVLTSTSPGGDTLEQFVPHLEAVCLANPGFKQVVKEVQVNVNRRKNFATAMVKVEFEGRPEGLRRPGVAGVEFEYSKGCGREVDGEGSGWRVRRWESVRGAGWGW